MSTYIEEYYNAITTGKIIAPSWVIKQYKQLIPIVRGEDAKYYYSYGVRFSTYAVPMIAGEIKRFIRDDGAIKVSRSIKSQAQIMNKFIEEYRHREGREPEVELLAEEFQIDAAEVVFVLESVRYPLSIYAETEEEGLSLADKIVAKGTPEETIDKMLLRDIIMSLPEREKKIIILRYFRDKTQSEIARELNVSQVQISRLEAKILEKMRSELLV